jgi:hypothetical protein
VIFVVLALGQAQHDALVVLARDRVALHPHPVPPLVFTAASSAQHARTPAGAGPPQQPVEGVFRGSSELFV